MTVRVQGDSTLRALQKNIQPIATHHTPRHCAILSKRNFISPASFVYGSKKAGVVFTRSPTRIMSTFEKAEPGKTRVGFIGLGILGYPMTENLLKAGYQVTVWNRSSSKCEKMAAEYGDSVSVATTPKEVVLQSDIIVSVLVDGSSFDAVAFGEDGLLQEMGPGKGFVDVSTVEAETSLRICDAITSKGGTYLAAPVSGSKGPAETGTLIFMTAGDKGLYEAALPLLDVMGKLTVFLGEIKNAANMKIVVNMVMGTMMESFAEGIKLAEASGLNTEDLLAVLSNGAMANPMFALKGPSMLKNEYPTAFPLKHQLKDMRFAVELAKETGTKVPAAASATETFEQALDMGLGDKDFSAVKEVQ
jgi:glyoxylate/succinic semialdehyde reductase